MAIFVIGNSGIHAAGSRGYLFYRKVKSNRRFAVEEEKEKEEIR
jgi:hypothetical protein